LFWFSGPSRMQLSAFLRYSREQKTLGKYFGLSL